VEYGRRVLIRKDYYGELFLEVVVFVEEGVVLIFVFAWIVGCYFISADV